MTKNQNYQKSARAYAQAIAISPDNYEVYYKLMKSYNAAQKYAQADSVFTVVKTAFEQGKLPAQDQEIKSVAIRLALLCKSASYNTIIC